VVKFCVCSWMTEARQWRGQTRSTRRRFRLTELICFDHGTDAQVIVTVFRNFFDTRYQGRPLMNAWVPSAQGGKIENRIFIPTLSPWPILK